LNESSHGNYFYLQREVEDILLKDVLEGFLAEYPDRFRLLYCVGSRWANVHMAAKNKEEYLPPPPPKNFHTLSNAALGWINESKIREHGFPPCSQTRVIVCGLPGVYDKLCGPRNCPRVMPDTILFEIGYTDEMVIKL